MRTRARYGAAAAIVLLTAAHRAHAQAPARLSGDTGLSVVFGETVHPALAVDAASAVAGARLRAALAVSDGEGRLRNLAVTAVLSGSGEHPVPPTTLTFSDDGRGADEIANDGVYEAFVRADRPGAFSVDAEIIGVASTGCFVRTVTTALDVLQSAAAVESVSSRADYLHDDGMVDQVVVTPTIGVSEGGEHVVTVRLRASNGLAIERSVDLSLGRGSAAVDVAFDAEDLASDLGADGPYRVEHVSVSKVVDGRETQAASIEDSGDTDAYQLTSFRRPRLQLTGDVRVLETSLDADGVHRWLNVTVDVNVDVPGTYSYSAAVVDSNGEEVGLSAGTQVFPRGISTIHFAIPESELSKPGLSGPYSLSNLVIFGPGGTLTERELPFGGGTLRVVQRSPAFQALTLERPIPSADGRPRP